VECKSDVLGSWYPTVGQEEVVKLFHSLNGKTKLKKISFRHNYVGTRGCRALVNLLKNPSTNIQHLDLSNSSIDNDNMTILCGAISNNKTLRVLKLAWNSYLSLSGCFSISTALSHQMTTVTQLWLDHTGIDDDGISFLGDALKINRKLRRLSLCDNELITLEGWKTFSKCLSHSSLKYLELDRCNIDDEGAATLATALATNTSLTKLNMSKNTRITSRGLVAFFSLLLDNKTSVLETLVMTNNNIDVEGMRGEDWGILSRALCDKTDIMSTFTSNHTFYSLKLNLPDVDSIDKEIQFLLDVNDNPFREDVARNKILKYHFRNGGTGMHALACVDESLLPDALELIGRFDDPIGYATMFEFVRSYPSLFYDSRAKPARTRKRKLP
jgi:hypothetical protein